MKKISINIKKDSLLIKYRNNKIVDTDMLNTSIINNDEIIFSDDYVIKNSEIVGLFLNDLFIDNHIDSIILNQNDLAEIFINSFNYISKKFTLVFTQDSNLSYDLCGNLIKVANLEKINCYTIPTYLIELLDRNSIKVESRNEVLFASGFMLDNGLDSYSKMYYKNSIIFGNTITPGDLDDFKTFCGINKYLKYVHLDKYDKNNLENLARIIYTLRRKNIIIQIHEDINDPDIISELKELNKRINKKYKIKLSLAYSKDYIEKNYGKQVIFTTLKYCSLLLFVIVASVFGYVIYNNYESEKKVDQITADLKALIGDPTEEIVEGGSDINIDIPEVDNTEDSNTGTGSNNQSYTQRPNYKQYINSYDKLLEINSDTVGWLKVNNTKIDYPVVRTTDNSYYLKRNYYKDRDYNGWVFMDYRNSIDKLDDNTIIYAHNRYYSGVMFGTLNKVTNESWYKKDSNLYISFNTLYKSIKWKIFSIYSIDVTNDYLYTNFISDEEHQAFLDMITSRSDIEFDTKPTIDDKILTLSTCLDDNKRLVVHAIMQQ